MLKRLAKTVQRLEILSQLYKQSLSSDTMIVLFLFSCILSRIALKRQTEKIFCVLGNPLVCVEDANRKAS